MTREEAIKRVKGYLTDCLPADCYEEVEEIIKALEQEPRWIPCSEWLPEVEELVLVTDDSGGTKTVDVDRCGQYENSNERFWYYTQNAVAWMPRPKPYQKGDVE